MTVTARQYRICTVTHDDAQYDAMRQSFAVAGFSDELAVFEVFRNTPGDNRYEPYEVIRQTLAKAREPILIFAHHDVRVWPGSRALLEQRLSELERLAPDWAVAGNAGGDSHGDVHKHLNDPAGCHRVSQLPRTVMNLDENLLIVRGGAGVSCSAGLSGFHLYGADLCLNALAAGRTCHIINFLLDHLSVGNFASPEYAHAQLMVRKHWAPRLDVAYVATTCQPLLISRWAWIERVCAGGVGLRLLRGSGATFLPAGRPVRNIVRFAAGLALALPGRILRLLRGR